jgi:catechol 2,3-dioxygenase-like lactoylglutathione lyase family enzyme
MSVLRLDHIQLAMPPGREAEARVFYEGILGIPEIPKPTQLAARGGCWFERGSLKVHLGVEQDFRPARKAHPAFVVDGIGELARKIQNAGHRVVDGGPSEGYKRVYADDPFGNRIELMEPLDPTD